MSSLTNPSRLLLRHDEELAVPRLLLAMPPADSCVQELKNQLPEADIHVFTTAAEVNEQSRSVLLKDKVIYSHTPEAFSGSFDVVVLFLQKSKPMVSAMVDQLCRKLAENGSLLLVGENGTGIKSWKKRLQNWGATDSIGSGCHSGLLVLNPDEATRNSNPVLEEARFPIDIAGTRVDIMSLPGVFSHGRLDVGTRLLLETLANEKIHGSVLDFGCGAGVIGSWLASRYSCQPTLLDTEAMALESARRTLKANGIDGTVIASHGLSSLSGKYDWIISNPPFHEGVKTRYDVTEAFLTQCREHLCRGGQLRIVANSFLRYRPLIEDAFGHCQELAKGNGFTIYGATLASKFEQTTL